MNRRIRVPEVRVIDEAGNQLGVLKVDEAIRRAQETGLDLVEISPTAKPPVCKIIDYGKYKYVQKKKAHEARRKQAVVHLKEVKMRPNTGEHDFQFKLRQIRRFLEEGNKAKVTVVFRGREMAHTDRGRAMMERILGELKSFAKIEFSPRMEGRAMTMVLGSG